MRNVMECTDYRELFPLELCGDISPDQKISLENHLRQCDECRKEFTSMAALWNLMGELPQPEPSEDMADRFNAVLSTYRKEKSLLKNPLQSLADGFSGIFTAPVLPRMAFSILLVSFGLGIGYFVFPFINSSSAYNRQIDSLSSQVTELKQMMMLSLLQDQSASMRLQAVSYTGELNTVDKQVIDALLMTLNKDPNVNVRLATLEALGKLAYEPSVREGLVRSIENQDSPIIQSAIADVMVRLNEKNSVGYLKKLLSRKDLNESVRINIEQSIQKLI